MNDPIHTTLGSSLFAERLAVLMYHRVGEAIDDHERRYGIAPDRFRAHMLALSARGMQPCSIEQLFAWLDGKLMLPSGSFLLTFDDGFLGVYEHALPVLEELGWPATVFLVSSLTGRTDAWSGRENPGKRMFPLLDAPHIREMRKYGVSFQSHTRSHPSLPQLDDDSLRAELAGSRADLEDMLGAEVPYLAYPFGRHDERVIEFARRAGYRGAFSVRSGFNRTSVDRFRIRRLDVFGTDSPNHLVRKMKWGANDGSIMHGVRYYLGRLVSRIPGSSMGANVG